MRAMLRTLGCSAALATALAPVSASVPEIRYAFNLSDFDGVLPLMGSRVRVDPATGEVFVVEAGLIRIFNATGMQTYSFVIDPEAGWPLDLVVEPSGDILVAVTKPEGFALLRFDYRGTPKGDVTPVLPGTSSGFRVDGIEIDRDGLLHILNASEFRITVIRPDGGFVRDLDLAQVLRIKNEDRGRLGIGGFGLDADGNVLLTVSEKFIAYVIAPDGTVRDFGTPGSAAGRFGVVGAITADDRGNLFVGDKQRSVVMMFDRNLEYVAEIGGYGDGPESLVRPQSVRTASGGWLFVSQMARRGVSVFRVISPPEPSPEGQEVATEH